MGAFITMQATATNEDAFQNTTGSAFSVTGQTNGLHCYNATTASGTRSVVGIRFFGTIPAGIAAIPQARITMYTRSPTGPSIAIHVYLQKNITPPVFATGTNNDVTSRTKTNATNPPGNPSIPCVGTGSVAYVSPAVSGNQNIQIDLGQDLFKELMMSAGAVFLNTADPYTATTPTTSPITNPVVFFEGDILSSGTAKELNMYSYDNYIADSTSSTQSVKDAAGFTLDHCPKLLVTALAPGIIINGVDERLHVALCQDSYCWSTSPSSVAPLSSVTVSSIVLGQPITQGAYKAQDGSLDVAPGGAPRGFATIQIPAKTGPWYQFTDPYGSLGFGSLLPEGRSGYTANGLFKDSLINDWSIDTTRVSIHNYGLGGTTIGAPAVSQTTGNWAEYDDLTGSHNSLDGITSYSNFNTVPNPTVTNKLFNFRDTEDGHTLLTLLVDPKIKHLLVLTATGGNNLFSCAQGAGTMGNGILPYGRESTSDTAWNNCKTDITTGILTFIRFCKRAWASVSGRPSGATIDFIVPGLPNMLVDDTRVPTQYVNEGAPATNAYHFGGTWTGNNNNPDGHYGGPNGTVATTNNPSWRPTGPAMAPFGNTASTSAGKPATGTVNTMARIPWLAQYALPSIFGAPITNVSGYTIPTVGAGRSPTKDDLAILQQIKAYSFCSRTGFNDLGWYGDTAYVNWFAHAAADAYGSTFAGTANSDKWTAAFNVFKATWGTYPYSAASYATGFLQLPFNNLNITIAYGTRNVTNYTFNYTLQQVLQPAAQSACTTLQGEGTFAQYVPMWDSLGSAVGGSTATTGSVDLTLLDNPNNLSDMERIAQFPAAALRTDYPNMQTFAENIITYGWGSGQSSFDDVGLDLGLSPVSYSQNEYKASATTGTSKVYKQSGFTWGPQPTAPVTLPFSPLIGNTGTDHQLDLEVPNGLGYPAGFYSFWECIGPWLTDLTSLGQIAAAEFYNLINGYTGYSSSSTYASSVTYMPYGFKGNARTQNPVMPLFPVTATPQEVLAGKIPHALSLSMNGPAACGNSAIAPDTVEPSDPNFGITYGGSLAPAYLVENIRSDMIPGQCAPEGMRLMFNNSDAQIETLLDNDPRHPTGAFRNTLKIFMVCLRDYGIIQCQTGGSAIIPCSGSPADQALWTGSLGVPAGSVLKLPPGTMTVDNVVGLIPPSNKKPDGTYTKREYVGAVESMYVASDLASVTSTVTSTTASADRGSFLDGIHLTQAASKTWCFELIKRARTGGSPSLLNLIPVAATVSNAHLYLTDSLGNILATDPTGMHAGDHYLYEYQLSADGPLSSASITMSTLAHVDGGATFEVLNSVSSAVIFAETAVDQASVVTLGSVPDGTTLLCREKGVCTS